MTIPAMIGRYRIVGRVAIGGMAEVFLGKLFGPGGFERAVVIKRVLPHLAQQKEFVSMFTDEARIVSQIRHPNVVAVSEFGTDANDLFLVMEYLEGESLDGLMRRVRATGASLDFALATHILAETCAGIHAAHELKDASGAWLGLVHRDLSPQNLFVTYDGQVKIIDFGIAKAADRFTQTEAGDIKGKFAYMSPEQCRGETLDRRSDIFSLGIVLYELTTGRRLFARANAALSIEAICHRSFPNPSELVDGYPIQLERCVLKALARDKTKRFATAAEMRRDLIDAQRAIMETLVPEEALAAEMRRLFPDRIEEKQALLQKVRAGQSLSDIPAAEVDVNVELPTVALAPHLVPGVPRRPPLLTVAGVLAGATALAGVGWRVLAPARDPLVAQTQIVPDPRPVAFAPAPPSPVDPADQPPAAPQSVTVRFESNPAGAQVWIQRKQQGTTPVDVVLERSDARLNVEIRHPGYHAERLSFIAQQDSHFEFQLVRIKKTPSRKLRKPAARDPNPGQSTKPPGIYRFQ